MLLTYKIKHNRDFSEELRKAQKVAEFCIKYQDLNRNLKPPLIQKLTSSTPCSSIPALRPSFSFSHSSSKFSTNFENAFPESPAMDSMSESNLSTISRSPALGDVKHIGLKSTISGQIIKKYSQNCNLKSARNVKLIIPLRAVNVDRNEKTLIIPCLKLVLNYYFSNNFKKISQIEIDSIYAYVAVVFPDQQIEKSGNYIGVDRNTKGHIAVLADPESGKVWKLGKMRYHLHKKYENIKKRLYNQGKNKQLKAVKKREKNIIKNLNHRISRKIVDVALFNGSGIKLENLKGIKKINKRNGSAGKNSKNKCEDKKRKKQGKETAVKLKRNHWSSEYSLNSWSFRQFQHFIEYKARLRGVEVAYIDPHATSKKCSRCGHIGNRRSKQFECPYCGHVDHADVNAAFNIALTPKGNGQFPTAREEGKGSTDTPQKVLDRTILSKRTSRKETSPQFAWEVCQFFA